MKILLILPKDNTYYYKGRFKKTLSYAPLTLTTLAALVPQEINPDIRIVDEGVESFNYNRNHYDVVGISCVASSANRAYELSSFFRSKGSLVILGGTHPTLNPEEAKKYADIVVTGHANDSWPKILLDFHNKKPLETIYHSNDKILLSGIFPKRTLLKPNSYLKNPTILASYGCTNSCSYCSINNSYRRFYTRSINEIINEINNLNNKNILFLDPNIIADKDFSKELFNALIPLKINWAGLSTIDITEDNELFNLAIKSGCIGLLMGFESFSQKSLNNCNKQSNDIKKYKYAVELCHDNNIRILGCFILGFDDDTKQDLEMLTDYIHDIKIDIPRFAILTPFPGTVFYYKLKKENRILTENWDLYDTEHVVFEPKNLSSNELLSIYRKIWQESYSLKNIYKRIFQCKDNRLLTSAINYGFRYYSKNIVNKLNGDTIYAG